MNLLRVFEHERLYFDEDVKLSSPAGQLFAFPAQYRDAINSFHTRSKGRFYDLIHNGIKFKQFVGVICVLDLTIEILPKIDKYDSIGSIDHNWHNILLDMLKACKVLRPTASQRADLRLRPNSILELYIGLYVAELEALINSGLVKKYRKVEDNQFSLRGAMLFSKQLKENFIHKERFYTRHFVYDRNHRLHQLLLQALELCKAMVQSGPLSDRIKRLISVWPEGTRITVSDQLFKTLADDRKTRNYAESLLIARLLLMNYHPDIKGGGENVFALLFDMNKLWEEFVYRQLKELEDELGFEVHNQTSVSLWKLLTDNRTKTVKPDLLLEYKTGKSGKRIIIDTKWKWPDNESPNDEDLKQMLVYKLYFHADEVLLFYPGIGTTRKIIGHFEQDVHHTAKSADRIALKSDLSPACNLVFVNLLNSEGSLKGNEEFGRELNKLEM